MCKIMVKKKNGFLSEFRQTDDSDEEGKQQWSHDDDLLENKILNDGEIIYTMT